MISKVYNEDWRITTANIPDKYFDWVVDDVPYGIGVGKMAYLNETKTTMILLAGKLILDFVVNER